VRWKETVKEMKDNNAAGNREILEDVLKLFGEYSLKLMVQLINSICETGECPKEFIEITVTMIALTI
jgi:hypothetical protein